VNGYAWLGPLVLGLAGIAAATVAVCLAKIDAQSYTAIISGVLGIGLGAGVHAQGVSSVSAADGGRGASAGT
jgi:hypothetical protein